MLDKQFEMSADAKRHYDSYVKLINSALDDYLSIESPYYQVVADAMKYSVGNGGKRIRPILVLEFCRISGGDIEDALAYACALEMIHSYSLIHDDLPCMDDDDFRRGKEACHKKYGYDFALLAGDALLTYTFKLASENNVPPEIAIKCVNHLSSYAGIHGMIGGQTMDILNEGNNDLKLEELEITHKGKTGALIRCACEMGCTIAGADEKLYAAAGEFAENLGLAFQIIDDILDVIGDPELLGKQVGVDMKNDKVTYVSLLGLDGAKERAVKCTENALNALDSFENAEYLREFALSLLCRKY